MGSSARGELIALWRTFDQGTLQVRNNSRSLSI